MNHKKRGLTHIFSAQRARVASVKVDPVRIEPVTVRVELVRVELVTVETADGCLCDG